MDERQSPWKGVARKQKIPRKFLVHFLFPSQWRSRKEHCQGPVGPPFHHPSRVTIVSPLLRVTVEVIAFPPLPPADPVTTAKKALLPECCSAGTLSRDPRLAVLGICTQRYGHRNAIPRFLLVRVCAVSNSTCACVWAFGEVCLTDTLRNAEICVCVRSACLRGSARA